jgi:hypothetical protein
MCYMPRPSHPLWLDHSNYTLSVACFNWWHVTPVATTSCSVSVISYFLCCSKSPCFPSHDVSEFHQSSCSLRTWLHHPVTYIPITSPRRPYSFHLYFATLLFPWCHTINLPILFGAHCCVVKTLANCSAEYICSVLCRLHSVICSFLNIILVWCVVLNCLGRRETSCKELCNVVSFW